MNYKKRPLASTPAGNDDLSAPVLPPSAKEAKRELEAKQEPTKPPASALTGIPCKAKKLGPTGWVEVTTTKGLKYYVSKTLNTTTWVCPSEASAWMMRREEEIKRSREERTRKDESKKQLDAEDEAVGWIGVFEQLISELKIPPILTYERAQKRMLQNKKFQAIPVEAREEAFKKARSKLLNSSSSSGSAPSNSGSGTIGLIKQLEDKLGQLKQNHRLRAEHSLEDVMSLFFTDERWLPVKDDARVIQLIKSSLNQLKEERREGLERMGDDMKEIFVEYFPRFLEEEDRMMGKPLKDLLMDDAFAVNFLDASNMSSFVKYIRDNLKSMAGDERALFMRFAALSDAEEMLGVVAEAWQTLCQSVWTNLVSSKKDN